MANLVEFAEELKLPAGKLVSIFRRYNIPMLCRVALSVTPTIDVINHYSDIEQLSDGFGMMIDCFRKYSTEENKTANFFRLDKLPHSVQRRIFASDLLLEEMETAPMQSLKVEEFNYRYLYLMVDGHTVMCTTEDVIRSSSFYFDDEYAIKIRELLESQISDGFVSVNAGRMKVKFQDGVLTRDDGSQASITEESSQEIIRILLKLYKLHSDQVGFKSSKIDRVHADIADEKKNAPSWVYYQLRGVKVSNELRAVILQKKGKHIAFKTSNEKPNYVWKKRTKKK